MLSGRSGGRSGRDGKGCLRGLFFLTFRISAGSPITILDPQAVREPWRAIVSSSCALDPNVPLLSQHMTYTSVP